MYGGTTKDEKRVNLVCCNFKSTFCSNFKIATISSTLSCYITSVASIKINALGVLYKKAKTNEVLYVFNLFDTQIFFWLIGYYQHDHFLDIIQL